MNKRQKKKFFKSNHYEFIVCNGLNPSCILNKKCDSYKNLYSCSQWLAFQVNKMVKQEFKKENIPFADWHIYEIPIDRVFCYVSEKKFKEMTVHADIIDNEIQLKYLVYDDTTCTDCEMSTIKAVISDYKNLRYCFHNTLKKINRERALKKGSLRNRFINY